MEDQRDRPDGPSDALRRDAGPAPEFELVRPFVASIGTPSADQPGGDPGSRPGSHARGRRRSLAIVDSLDATQEIRPTSVWPHDFPSAPAALLTARWRPLPLILIGLVVLLTGMAVAYFLSTPDNPNRTALPGGIVALPAVTAPSRAASPSPSAAPSATTHVRPPSRSTHPSASPLSPSAARSNAPGIAAPTPSPVPSFSPPPTSAVTGVITGVGGLCVDDNGRVSTDGNAIQIYGCNQTPAQDWTFQPDSTVQVVGKCLQPTKPVAGGQAVIWDCNGSAEQVWRRGPAGSLVNITSGLCLEDPGASQQWGTQLDLATCTGAADEAWVTPL